MSEFKISSLEDLKKISEGEIVPLDGFYDNKPFNVRLKRPSLLSLAANKQIPNTLLNTAYRLFYGEEKGIKAENNISENAEIYKIIAKASLVEPKYQDIKDAGLELTDTQLLQIWQFSQFGGAALDSFRAKYTSDEDSSDKQEV